ncbi:hypothetical protein RFI_25258 [Reticulomyxa filosa]|uniref:Uncharacterized protein n=1 Tax=Reticulomyxa filosa TaxID=46433 RepID=X6MDM1_RETFI|nr:hypothetical protein RFI_25258 [Reticulomyxa filosa]|eukprot:ETO12118.1 hypothetical protein RFI_25258 [Reticulomyxa filosa]
MLNTTKYSSKDQKSALSTIAAISKPIQTQTQTQMQMQMQMQNSNAIANANDTSVNNGNASNTLRRINIIAQTYPRLAAIIGRGMFDMFAKRKKRKERKGRKNLIE